MKTLEVSFTFINHLNKEFHFISSLLQFGRLKVKCLVSEVLKAPLERPLLPVQESFIHDCDNYYGLHDSGVMQMVLILRPEVRAIYLKLHTTDS